MYGLDEDISLLLQTYVMANTEIILCKINPLDWFKLVMSNVDI